MNVLLSDSLLFLHPLQYGKIKKNDRLSHI